MVNIQPETVVRGSLQIYPRAEEHNTCIGYSMAASAARKMQSQVWSQHEGHRPECFDPTL